MALEVGEFGRRDLMEAGHHDGPGLLQEGPGGKHGIAVGVPHL
jgi:hypothetical protein